jgi:uncharacterized protein YoxC
MDEVSLIIMAVAWAGLAIVGIPTLIELRRVAKETRELLQLFQAETGPLLRELQSTAQNVNDLAERLDTEVDRVQHFSHWLAQTGRAVLGLGLLHNGSSKKVVMQGVMVGAGVRAALGILRRLKKRARAQSKEVRHGQ